jgi:hypothetical protein
MLKWLIQDKVDTMRAITYNLKKDIRQRFKEAGMQTKLTLRLEDKLIDHAKSYAAQAGKSVSQIVAEYFQLLTTQQKKTNLPQRPVTDSLRGLLRQSKLDETDYKKHLEDKHL